MSAQTISEAFAPVEAHYRAEIFAETWGHLAPRKNKLYRGSIIFAVGIYGDDALNPTVLKSSFEGLEDSPWFFEAQAEFLAGLDFEEGCVYRFEGTFRNYVFKGDCRKLL